MINHYRALVAKPSANAETCFSNEDAKEKFLRCHNFLGDIDVLRKLTLARPECYCVEKAQLEYQFALSALLSGHYRHAFLSLRLASELLFYAIYFSAHEVKILQWKSGHRDLTWQKLQDEDKGIFSAPFVRAFCPEMVELRKKYAAISVAAYRECSEYVHGNPSKSALLRETVDFDEDSLSFFENIMQSLRISILFCFIFRYSESYVADAKMLLDPLVLSDFHHETEIREVFGKI